MNELKCFGSLTKIIFRIKKKALMTELKRGYENSIAKKMAEFLNA